MLISAVIRNKDFLPAMKAGVVTPMFHAFGDEWDWIERYYTKHRRQPTAVAFKHAHPDFTVRAVDDTDHYIEEVRKSHARHVLMETMSKCTDLIATGDLDRAVAFMNLEMNKVAGTMSVTGDMNVIEDWETVAVEAEGRRERYEQFGMAGIPTGFTIVDERTGGVQPGQSWIVGARLGEKKSWVLARMAVAALLGGFNVHLTALEMSSTEVAIRIYNFLSGSVGKQVFESQSILMGTTPNMKAYRAFLRGLRATIKANMTVSDTRGVGLPEFRAQLERNQPDIWYLDYMTLANTGGDGGWQDIGKLSKGLGQLAKEYDCGVVSAAQLNREAAGGRGPAGTDTLAQSDQIGQDAHAVITTKQLSSSVNVFKMSKFRHGKAGYKWYAHFDPSRGVFEEVDKQRADDLVDQDRVNGEDD